MEHATSTVLSTEIDFVPSHTTPMTSSQQNTTMSSDWLWTPITWSWWVSMQLALALLGIFGNLLVLLVLFHRRSFKKSTDILIGGLAAADFITSIFMIPQPKLSVVPDTILGNVACKLVYSSIFLWISISASVFTLTAIAIERYLAVIYPIKFKRWVTPRRLTVWFAIIWLSAFAINSRTFGTTIVDSEKRKCVVRYRLYGIQIGLGIAVFLIRFIIPAIIMVLSYSLIARSLRLRSKRFKTKPGPHIAQSNNMRPGASLLTARMKVIKLMLVIIVTFIVCWAADSIGLLAYNVRLVDRSYLYSPLYHVFVIIAFFNTCANPLIYTTHYPEFRSAIKDLLSCSQDVKDSLFGKDLDQEEDYNPTNRGKKYVNTIV